jgi:hypothetical protein
MAEDATEEPMEERQEKKRNFEAYGNELWNRWARERKGNKKRAIYVRVN